jgi:hypothetical protein
MRLSAAAGPFYPSQTALSLRIVLLRLEMLEIGLVTFV